MSLDDRIVSYYYAWSSVPIDTILFDLWKAASTHNDASSLVLINIVFWQMWRRVKHNNSVVVVVDLVVLYPAEPTLYHKDTLTSWRVYPVIVYDCVTWIVSSKSYVSFVVCEDIILLYVSTGSLNQKNALSKIRTDLVPHDRNMSSFHTLYSCSSIVRYWNVLINHSIVFPSCTHYSIFFVLFDDIKFN